MCLQFALADVTFSGLDLDNGTGLLFSAKADAPVYGPYATVFSAALDTKALTQLTFFPEHIVYLGATRELQIQNRFGVFRASPPYTNPEPLNKFPGFGVGAQIPEGKLNVAQASPDGTWLVYQRPTSPAYAELVLLNVRDGTDRILAPKVDLALDGPTVRWSPQSDVLVYERDNILYYYPVSQSKSGKTLDEKYRVIGQGKISAAVWGERNQLYYISRDMVYEILSAELFTRSLYQDFMKMGRIVGRLPHEFDLNFDRFWMSPDGVHLLLSKNDRHLYVYSMDDKGPAAGLPEELPFLQVPQTSTLNQVIWSLGNIITLVFDTYDEKGAQTSAIYRLDMTKIPLRFQSSANAPHIREIVLNNDTAAILYDNAVEFRSYSGWLTGQIYQFPSPLHAVFTDTDKLVVTGTWYAEMLGAKAQSREFLFFSQADAFGYDRETGLPTLKSNDRSFSRDSKRWLPREPFALKPAQTANDQVRVYAETLYAGPYQNVIMIRKVRDIGTASLFTPPNTAYEPFPKKDEPVDFQIFTHGSRTRDRAVALTFDAIDSAEGLETILSVLRQYNIKATFFLNGEFIRRFPDAIRTLSLSGNEVGSLFYMYFNLADNKYQISSDFIKQGLARNEDEYFETSKKELSLLWRTPYGVVNRPILDASKELKYTLVGRDVDSLDSVSKGGDTPSDLYAPSAQLVEKILKDKKPGSVIQLSVGIPGELTGHNGKRDDYVFQKLDVLINALLQQGYHLVPVSTLIEDAR